MSLPTKYELEKLVYDGPTKTFKAKQIATGDEVYLHLLSEDGDALEQGKLLEKVRSLGELSRSLGSHAVIEVGDVGETPYVATEVLASFRGLEAWVEEEYRGASARTQQTAKNKAQTQLAAGDTALALQTICKGLEDVPDDSELAHIEQVLRLLNRGSELCQGGSDEEGVRLLAQAYRLNKDDPQVRSILVEALTRRATKLLESDRKTADVLLQQVLELDPGHPEAGRLSHTVDPEREEFIRWCLSQAERLEKQGDRKGVRALVGPALAKYPTDIRLLDLQSRAKKSWRSPTARDGAVPKLRWRVVSDHLRRYGRAIVPSVMELSRRAWVISKRKLPRVAASLSRTSVASPLLPAVLGAVVAVVLVAVVWLASGVKEEPPAAVAVFPVRLNTSPAGAVLSIDGQGCGTSSCKVDLAVGRYQAEARLAGYEPSTLFFEVSDSDTNRSPITISLVPLPTVLRISSDLAQGEVTLDNEVLGALEEGELEAELDALESGEHVLAISAPGGIRALVRFEAGPGSLPVVQPPLETRELRALVVASFGPQAKIYCNSEIGQAILDGQALEAPPGANPESNTLAEGAHELEVRTAGRPHRVVFDSGDGPSLAAFLQTDRNVGALRIDTEEDDVTIFLNGKKYRRKTRRGRALIYLYPNKYSVRVEKDGFRSPEEQVAEIKKGEQRRLDFRLVSLPATASLKIRNGVPGASVLVDGNEIGTIPENGLFSASNIEPGRRRVTVRKDLYQPFESEQRFEANRSVEIEARLESALGTLRVEVSPSDVGARLSLRREGEGIARAIDDSSLQLADGTYTVTAIAEGFGEYGATVRVRVGETKTVRLQLQPLTEKGPRQPTFRLKDWAKNRGWLPEGDLLTRSGGGLILAPVEGGAGVYEFSALLRRGRRLEWVLHHVDRDNYALFQIGKNFFHRTEIANGRKSRPFKIPHSLPRNGFITVQIEVTPDSLIHRLLQNGEWSLIDSWRHTGAEFTAGRFGFHVPRRHRIAVRSVTFTPRF